MNIFTTTVFFSIYINRKNFAKRGEEGGRERERGRKGGGELYLRFFFVFNTLGLPGNLLVAISMLLSDSASEKARKL